MSPPRHAHWVRGADEGGFGDPAARFPYWSVTKTVIAALAVDLAEAGALDLDAPLSDAAYTLRHLLQHRSGLPDYGSLPAYHQAVAAGDPPWPRAEMIARTLAQGPLFAPGAGWAYSNLGYSLAVAEIEAVTGTALADLIAERVAAPLGLASLRLAHLPEDIPALPWPAPQSYHPGWVYHGCLIGTAGDAARLLDGLMRGAVISDRARAQMCDAHPLGGALTGRPWRSHGYGLGLMIGQFGPRGRAMGHGGTGPFSVTSVLHFPDLATPLTVACFAPGQDDGVTERMALEIRAEIETQP